MSGQCSNLHVTDLYVSRNTSMPNTLLSLVSLGNTWQLGVLLYFFFELQSATQEVFLILVYIILQCETRKKKKRDILVLTMENPSMLAFLEREVLSAWSDGSKEVRIQWQEAIKKASNHNSLRQTQIYKFLFQNHRKFALFSVNIYRKVWKFIGMLQSKRRMNKTQSYNLWN